MMSTGAGGLGDFAARGVAKRNAPAARIRANALRRRPTQIHRATVEYRSGRALNRLTGRRFGRFSHLPRIASQRPGIATPGLFSRELLQLRPESQTFITPC